jgi:hypothetical protein
MSGEGFELGEAVGEILELLRSINRKLDDMSAAQTAIDAATSSITTATTSLNADAPLIEAELAAGVDTTALTASLAPLNSAVAGINALAHPVTTSSTTSVTPTSTSTVTATDSEPAADVTVTPARTVGTGAPGDPVRPA